MNIKDNLTQLIGDTPLMYLANVQNARVAVKLEYFQPLGSGQGPRRFCNDCRR